MRAGLLVLEPLGVQGATQPETGPSRLGCVLIQKDVAGFPSDVQIKM